MNLRQKIAIIILDVLILAELSLSIYFGNRDPINLTPIFLRTFFLMLIPTLLLARITVYMLKTRN